MDGCIFCMIANGEIPSATLYEDDCFKVILDLGPARRGHALVLPKAHYANIFEMPDEEVGKAFSIAKKVADALVKACGADGVQIVQNNGSAAGQTVFHVHIHLIPGYTDLGPGAIWQPGELKDEDKDEIVANIKNYL